ncbi:MAG: oxygenase MpaB family protein [Ilumatobacteraceae bacterium]|jgi:uncharacterized protein (DUF2236 family)
MDERRSDVMAALEPARRALADAVRNRVVGDRADERAAELFTAPGPRWFADDRPIRIVHGDVSMFIGGLRALLFQSLHPLAMAGVAAHSDYRADPWGRLQRTADFLAATTFGPATESERAIAMVKRVHERVTGLASDGRPYRANDPHLLKWVHIAEVDSFVAAHRAFGETPLSDHEYDHYVADMAVIAERLGVVEPPRSMRQLKQQLRYYRRELDGSKEARDAARYLLFTPPLPLVVRPAYGLIGAAAVSLMPAWTRLPLRIPWFPVAERAVARPAGVVLARTLRWALSPDAPNRQVPTTYGDVVELVR